MAESGKNRFTFVSRDSCTELRGLSERSRGHDEVSTFYDKLSKSLKTSFNQLSKLWQLDYDDKPENRAVVFAMLQRCYVEARDLASLKQSVALLCHYLIDNDPDATRTLLADFAIEKLGRRLDRTAIVEFLTSKQIALQQSVNTQSVIDSIIRLKQSFFDSINPYLINGQLLERPESETLVTQAVSTEPDRPKLIMVHGKAGFGKSGVLYEFAKRLEQQEIPFLPLRLDRKIPTGSAEYYGREQCGLSMSPAFALKSVAGVQRSVLILDQLDALRWTSTHTDQPMDVLTEIIRDALDPLLGADITVVLVCRTFDLQDDPRIAYLKALAKPKYLEKEIGPLTTDATRKVTDSYGKIWDSLSELQRTLLQQPQALYLWNNLRGSTRAEPVFCTYTDLMRSFWEDVYQTKRPPKIPASSIKNILDLLVDYMDGKKRLTAPASLIQAGNKQILDLLQSLNILRVDENRQCILTHQSYFDYSVAEKLNHRILTGETTLTDWIKDTNQSLFRREQLRQVLSLQRDDDPPAYIKAIKEILNDSDIRFHLKHLILRFLSQANEPTQQEVDLIASLINHADWREQVFTYVVQNNPIWFTILNKQNIWRNWLKSDDENLIHKTLWLISRMTSSDGPCVDEILNDLIDHDDSWSEKIAKYLQYSDSEKESDEIFKLRVGLAQRGHQSIFHVPWQELSKSKPNRAMRLFILLINLMAKNGQALQNEEKGDFQDSGIEFHKDYATKWILRVAVHHPAMVWKHLAPVCVQLEQLCRWAHDHNDWTRFNSPNGKLSRSSRDLLGVCEKVLVASGRALARRQPEVFIHLVEHCNFNQQTQIIERSLLRSMATLHGSYANFAAQWIIVEHHRLQIDDGLHRSKQEAARNTLARILPHCSSETISQVEVSIMAYRDPDLKLMLKYAHENVMEGHYYPNHYGRAQYNLLSAIPTEFLKERTKDQLGVWQRKFGSPQTGYSNRSRGGIVESTIPKNRLHHLSNNTWIQLVKGDWKKREHNRLGWKQISKGRIAEASRRHFSSDIETMARRQPSRFAKLALKLPDDAPPCYMVELLQAFEQQKSPDMLTNPQNFKSSDANYADALKQEFDCWQPATAEEIEAVIKKLGFPENSEIAKEICWLIERRDDITWSESTINLIARIAIEHDNPVKNEYVVQDYDPQDKTATIPDIGDSAINCARGVAAQAIKNLLSTNRALHPQLEDAINSLSHDDNVAIRASAIAICLPMLNIDRNAAVTYFLTICETTDDRVFQSHYINDFLRYAFWSHNHQLIPIVERMVNSDFKEVAKRGASWATAAWTYEGWCKELLDYCQSSSTSHRQGIAEVAGPSSWEKETMNARIKLLPDLFDDDDKDVRHNAGRFFWNEESWNDERIIRLGMTFIKSRSFSEDPTPLIRGLSEVKGSILHRSEIVLAVADAFAGALSDAAKDISQGIAMDVPDVFKLLLRVYQQAQDCTNDSLQNECLDRWDALLQSGVYGYRDAEKLLDEIEQ